MIKKYRKKPIVIEAIEITGPEVFPEIEKWMDGAVLKYPTDKIKVKESSNSTGGPREITNVYGEPKSSMK